VTDTPAAQAGTVVGITFVQTNPTTWTGTASCIHGTTRNATYHFTTGAPPLNHAAMVQNLYRQHDCLVGCVCTQQNPIANASVSFQPANAVQPGQQRYVPQQSATLSSSNLWWGPGLTCGKTGAYQIDASVKLSRTLAQGAGGLGVIVISGVPTISVPMTDQGGVATAVISAMLNLTMNQSVQLGYENTSANVQDVQQSTLIVSQVWVP